MPKNMTWDKEDYSSYENAQTANWQTHAYEACLVLIEIKEQLQIHNTTQRGIAHALHDINNSIQTLASAVRNLE